MELPFDIVAYYESQQATTFLKVAAVEDDLYRISGDDLFIQAKAPQLVGVFVSGVSTPKYMRLNQPSLEIPYYFYKAVLGTVATRSYGFTNLLGRPLPLIPGEKLNCEVQNATDEVSAVVLFLSTGKLTKAAQDAVNPTHTLTGYADSTLTAGVWNDVTPTWDQDLPKGKYAIVGMKAGSYLATCTPLATRLVCSDFAKWRPGVITHELGGDKTLMTQDIGLLPYELWPLMQGISFNHDNPPSLEIFTGTADTDHVVELALQKVG